MGLWNVIKMIGKGTVLTTKVAVTGVRVAGHLTSATLRGTASTLQTVNQALDKASRKDWDGLEELATSKFEQVGRSLEEKLQLAVQLEEEATACLEDRKRPFLTKENAKRIAGVISLGGIVAGGIAVSDALDGDVAADTDVATDMLAVLDDSDGIDTGPVTYAHGGLSLTVNNGVFDGDASDLETLTTMGQVEGTEHMDAEDTVRDTGVRDRFLRSHGFESVPEGYEVHHIVPLCEGGADSPENMILIREEEHAVITAAHARYYGWHQV